MRVWKWGGVFVSCFLLAFVAVAGPAQALGKVKFGKVAGCPVIVGVSPNDSTRLNGMPDATSHMHEFFGNPVFAGTNTVSYADAVAAGPNPCATEPNDTAGQWHPVVCLNADCSQIAPVLHETAYYRCSGGLNNGCPLTREIPADARLISSNYNWTCGQNSGSVLSKPLDHIPDCSAQPNTPGRILTAHVTFQDGWDGLLNDHTVVGDINDNVHFAACSKRAGCPAGFSPVAQVKYAIEFAVPFGTDYSTLYISSDPEHGTTGGRSMHADYDQTWQPVVSGEGTTQQAFLDRCVVPSTQATHCG
jgi:hypothetical protein